MKIIAFDPGVTTGIALLNDQAHPIIHCEQHKWELNVLWKALQLWGAPEPYDAIVFEKFTPPAATRHRVELFPVQVIGVLRLFAQQYGVPEFSHTASEGKGFWTDTKIKRLSLWQPGEGHAMDALRHLLHHLTFAKGDKTWVNALRPKG